MFNTNPLAILAVILVVVFVWKYLATLPAAMRKQQTQLAGQVTVIGASAFVTFLKELFRLVGNAGVAASNEVQLVHKESINEFDRALQAKLEPHKGSTKRYGVHLGREVADAVMLTPANKHLEEILASQKAREALLAE